MRTTNSSLRTAFLMVSAFAGLSLAATDASAEVAGGSSNSSIGNAALHYEHTQSLDSSIGTGWLNQSITLGVAVHARAIMHIDPVKDGGPLFIVDMPKGAVVEASWSNDKKITLKAQNGSSSDGQVKVRHSLSPDVEVKVSQSTFAPWNNGSGGISVFNYDATSLMNQLPGAKFDYDSQATQAFAPWGFTKVDTVLNAPLLAQSTLFSKGFATTDPVTSNPLVGSIGLRAVTKPTFSYQTTKVTLQGAPDITSSGGEVVIDAVDGDYLEKTVTATGTMDVAGSMDIQPVVTINKAFGLIDSQAGVPVSFDVYSKDYTVPTIPIAYNSVTVHIPLPNVKAPKSAVSLGTVRAGASAQKTVTITNTGEKAAVLTMQSSDPQFTVPSGQVTIEPKGSYDATIGFNPNAAGAAEATITVLSNDPDSPEQTFKISANGADDTSDGATTTTEGDSPAADSGCGCKTAGGTSNLPSWAGFGLLGLGALVLGGRRRRGN